MTYAILDRIGHAFLDKPGIPPIPPLASAMLKRLRLGLEARRDRRRLHMMPDSILKDMGISRADIDYLPADAELRARLRPRN